MSISPIEKLTRSIDDACKISRRHCGSMGNIKAHRAAMKLVRELTIIRDAEQSKHMRKLFKKDQPRYTKFKDRGEHE